MYRDVTSNENIITKDEFETHGIGSDLSHPMIYREGIKDTQDIITGLRAQIRN
jgi:hypothetical protein